MDTNLNLREKHNFLNSLMRIFQDRDLHEYDVVKTTKYSADIEINSLEEDYCESLVEDLIKEMQNFNKANRPHAIEGMSIHTTKVAPTIQLPYTTRLIEITKSIVRPFEKEYPENFNKKISNLSEYEIENFVEFQYNKCCGLQNRVFAKYCLSIIDENQNFKEEQTLKYWLTRKRLEEPFNEVIQIYEADNRIKGRLSKVEIEDFLSPLREKQKDGKPVLTEEEFNYFLRANFVDFNPKVEPRKFDTPNYSQMKLRKLIYKFYDKDKIKGGIGSYVELLVKNFHKFDNTTINIEKTNFNKGSLG